jgi:hypothetical protein
MTSYGENLNRVRASKPHAFLSSGTLGRHICDICRTDHGLPRPKKSPDENQT